MTDQVQVSESQSAPMSPESGAPVSAPVVQEKMIPQSEVNKIVGRIKDESYTKGRNEALNTQQQAPVQTYQQPVAQPSYQQQGQQQSYAQPQITDEQLNRKIWDAQQHIEQTKDLQNKINSFVSKVESGKSKYENFDSEIQKINLPQMPIIWQTAEKFDNPADIVWHLKDNPAKLANLLTVGNFSPELVKKGMQEIADSLKQNEAAAQEKQPNAPLTRLKPSNVGMGNGDSRNLTAQDWKKIRRV